MSDKPKLNDLIGEALGNVRSDRREAKEALKQIKNYCKKSSSPPVGELGHSFTKFLESLTRSNEQLIKIVSIESRKNKTEEEYIDEGDIDSVYDTIQEEE